jgi:hypothetical protein
MSMTTVSEGFCTIDNVEAYLIPDLNTMRPFLMSLVSDCDLWMYVSSHGSLTAGRSTEDRAIFPYQTDDVLHLTPAHAGPLTLLHVGVAGEAPTYWTPFSEDSSAGTRRSLAKSLSSSRITFEECHRALPLTFRYTWAPTREFGFVRTCVLTNHGHRSVQVSLLDGFRGILPAGADLGLQQGKGCLINAYSQSEFHAGSTLATYTLSSLIVDRAEPAESLYANTAFVVGLPGRPVLMLTTDQIADFRRDPSAPLVSEQLLTGRRGNYFAATHFTLAPGESVRWYGVVDASRDQTQVARLLKLLRSPESVPARLETAMTATDQGLRRLLASADGYQATADKAATAHHLANTLFNTLRGGAFDHNGMVPADDFRRFVRQRNPEFATRQSERLSALSGMLSPHALLAFADDVGDPNFYRLASEYLPLHFGRRHGDPSRPWNRFAIRTTSDTGEPIFDYQGNWRDIFQNWEALAHSFPEHIHTFISRFLNASTADGFNPYRITRDGIDWEVPDPHDPWSNIGYWGDHQIIYLLKLLEASHRFNPGQLESLINRRVFAYANVPYRLKPYAELLKNPRETIVFDFDLNRRINADTARLGADAKLLADADGNVVHATLVEKLLIPALTKIANLVHGAGIWMNTQRPEWNDANNALVGIGVSMVTQCYLRRYCDFLLKLIRPMQKSTFVLSRDVADFMAGVMKALQAHEFILDATVSDAQRKALLDAVASPFDTYRSALYARGLGPGIDVPADQVLAFVETALKFMDAGIKANRREDGLYHAYNLFELSDDQRSLAVGRLPLMLEGQVAVLSSGLVAPCEAADVLQTMFDSPLYRPDQQSFLLYPERPIAAFLDRGRVPAELVATNPLLVALTESGDSTLIVRDADNEYRFSSTFRKGEHVRDALASLKADSRFEGLVTAHGAAVLAVYESAFQHSRFTGRSGSMFGYEGIGCIYWHMVAKLMLAAQECYVSARASEDQTSAERLKTLYYRVRSGLGFNKAAAVYGAFPPDPYSHTPKHAGAQQPGMTGQVKEELLTRLRELGVTISKGSIFFSTDLLKPTEICPTASTFKFIDVSGKDLALSLPPNSLAFTLCQVPVMYVFDDTTRLEVAFADGSTQEFPSAQVPATLARQIFERQGTVRSVRVFVSRLCQ